MRCLGFVFDRQKGKSKDCPNQPREGERWCDACKSEINRISDCLKPNK